MDMTPAEHARMTAKQRPWLIGLEIAALGVAGAIILAPYLLPAVGIGNVDLAEETMTALHSTSVGSGLAGMVAKGLNAIPWVGPSLAAGGWATTATAGVIGIGGTLAGNAMASKAETPKDMRWCRIITDVALVTSSLISLPALLTGISAGIIFLSAVLSGPELASSSVTFMAGTLGSVGTATVAAAGAGGAIATAARLLTCCMPALPTGFLLATRKRGETTSPHAGHDAMEHGAMAEASLAMRVALSSAPIPGHPCEGTLILTDVATGLPVTSARLDVRHEHKLHLMIVDDALRDYHHVHPMPTETPGEYAFTFTPQSARGYHFWIEAQRHGAVHGATAHAAISALASAARLPMPPVNSVAEAGGLVFRWSASPPLRQGQDSVVALAVETADGQPVRDLEPIMGAPAHLAGFTANVSSMMHLHPQGGDVRDGRLRFHLRPTDEGRAEFFLQVAKGGHTITAAFGQSVYSAKKQQYDAPAIAQGAQHGRGATI